MRSMKLNGPGWSRAVGHMGNVGLHQDHLRQQRLLVRLTSRRWSCGQGSLTSREAKS
jgi:hypothetical protein